MGVEKVHPHDKLRELQAGAEDNHDNPVNGNQQVPAH